MEASKPDVPSKPDEYNGLSAPAAPTSPATSPRDPRPPRTLLDIHLTPQQRSSVCRWLDDREESLSTAAPSIS